MSASEPVNLAAKLASFVETWAPRIVARVNDVEVKLVKLDGEFVWHSHPEADELFFVLRGGLELRFRERASVRLGPGELFVVPRGVEHLPVAEPETEVMLIEPVDTVNTGDAGGPRTRAAVAG